MSSESINFMILFGTSGVFAGIFAAGFLYALGVILQSSQKGHILITLILVFLYTSIGNPIIYGFCYLMYKYVEVFYIAVRHSLFVELWPVAIIVLLTCARVMNVIIKDVKSISVAMQAPRTMHDYGKGGLSAITFLTWCAAIVLAVHSVAAGLFGLVEMVRSVI